MKAIRRTVLAAVIAATSVVVVAPPASAGGCHLPKPSCTVYYTACAVAAEAGLTCVD